MPKFPTKIKGLRLSPRNSIIVGALLIVMIGALFVVYHRTRAITESSQQLSHQPALADSLERTPAKESKIAYQADDGGLWIMNVDGTNKKQLDANRPEFSKVAFSSDGNFVISYGRDTVRYDLSDGTKTTLSEHGLISPLFDKSADAKLVKSGLSGVGRSREYAITITDQNGQTNQYDFSDNPRAGGATNITLLWSPDEKKIAYQTSGSIGYIDIGDQKLQSLYTCEESSGVCDINGTPKIAWANDSQSILWYRQGTHGIFGAFDIQAIKLPLHGKPQIFPLSNIANPVKGGPQFAWDTVGQQFFYWKYVVPTNDITPMDIYEYDLDSHQEKQVYQQKSQEVLNVGFYPSLTELFITTRCESSTRPCLPDSFNLIDLASGKSSILPMYLSVTIDTPIAPDGTKYIGGDAKGYALVQNSSTVIRLPIPSTQEVAVYWAK